MTQTDVAEAKASPKLIERLSYRIITALISVGIAVWICLLTPPEGLTVEAIRFIGCFMGGMLLCVFRSIPDWLASLAALMALVLLKVGSFAAVFAPFSGTTLWLIIPAYGIACVVGKTGLLKRVALHILSWFPDSFTGQVSALFVAGIIISPCIPSTLAKMSIFAPFTEQVATEMGYERNSKGAAGLFLSQWVSAGLLGYGFYSGSFAVAMMLGLTPIEDQAYFNWGTWLATCAAWLVVMTVLSYIFILLVYKPKTGGKLPKGFTKGKVKELGPMSKDEKKAAVVLIIILLAWIGEGWHGIAACYVAIMGWIVFGLLGMFDKKEVATAIPWGELIYMMLIFTAQSMIGSVGISAWLQGILDPILSPLFGNTFMLILAIIVTTYILRFVILSQFTIAVIIYAILGGLAQQAGMNGALIVLIVYVSGNIHVLDFQNSVWVTARVAAHSMVEQAVCLPYCLAWLVINLLGWWASVPLWQALGLM